MTNTAEQLTTTRDRLAARQAKRQRVERLAQPPSDYPTRAAARIQIEDLDAEIAQLTAALPGLEAAAAREAALVELRTLASAGLEALEAIEAIGRDADAALLPLVERLSAAQQRQHDARGAFLRLLRSSGIAPDDLAAELGADLAGVGYRLGGSASPIDVDRPAPRRFPGALALALREEAQHRQGYPLAPGALVIALPPEQEEASH
jgi:hypothetical protein